MTIFEIQRAIEKGEIAPVYFFFGREIYFIDEVIRTLVQKVVESGTRDFNLDTLQSEYTDGETIVRIASSYPMMAEKRLVVVKSVQRLSEKDRELLLSYIKSPLESTCLVLTAGIIDKRKKFYSALVKGTLCAECAQLYENQAVSWVKDRSVQKGITISDEAAQAMVSQAGTALWSLHHEIEKVITFSWGKKEITLSDVISVVGYSRQYNPWDLTDSVGRKDFRTALEILNGLLEYGYPPTRIIIDLFNRIKLLMQVRTLLDRRLSEQKIWQSLGLKPFFGRLYTDQSKRYRMKELESAMEMLLQADLLLKSSPLKSQTVISLVIHDIISGLPHAKWYAAM